MGLDKIDFIVLKTLHDTNNALWKNRIHKLQPEVFGDKVSVQTVGRRVDKLRDRGLLDSCIVSPEDIKRDLIIAFQLTEKGEEALQEKRREMLMNAVHNELFIGQDEGSDLSNEALIELIHDEFDISQCSAQKLKSNYTRKELLSFLTLYYVRKEVLKMFTEDHLDQMMRIAEENPELSRVVESSLKDDLRANDLPDAQ